VSEYDYLNEYTEQTLRPGQLGINSHVIHDTRDNVLHQRSIGHEVAPRLFMPEMREREAVRRENRATQFAEVQEMLFLQESPDDAFSAEAVRTSLFVDRPLEQVRVFGDTSTGAVTTPMPGWAIGIFVVLGLIVLAGISVFVGQKFAKRGRRHDSN